MILLQATSVDHLAMEYSPFPSQLKLAVSQPHIASPGIDELGAMRQQLHDIGQRRERLKLSDSGLSELREADRQVRQCMLLGLASYSWFVIITGASE